MKFVVFSKTMFTPLSYCASESDARVERRRWEQQGWAADVCDIATYDAEITPRISVTI